MPVKNYINIASWDLVPASDIEPSPGESSLDVGRDICECGNSGDAVAAAGRW